MGVVTVPGNVVFVLEEAKPLGLDMGMGGVLLTAPIDEDALLGELVVEVDVDDPKDLDGLLLLETDADEEADFDCDC